MSVPPFRDFYESRNLLISSVAAQQHGGSLVYTVDDLRMVIWLAIHQHFAQASKLGTLGLVLFARRAVRDFRATERADYLNFIGVN